MGTRSKRELYAIMQASVVCSSNAERRSGRPSNIVLFGSSLIDTLVDLQGR